MTTNKGKEGELIASNYLKNKGYNIIQNNFTSKFGEIDIIAEKDGTIIFIEVKLRQGKSYEGATGAVHYNKIKKLIKTAKYWIALKNEEVSCRFDVIAIENNEVEHIQNAFTL
jgi:putative endonuclease